MSAAGDLTAVLTLEEFEFQTGLRDAAKQTEEFASHAEHAGGRFEHAFGHRVQHKIEHLTFALIALNSMGKGSEDMAGKLESALTLAPMIGSAFGPVGTAVGVAAGVIGAVLIPKLEEAKEAAKQFGEELERSGREWEKQITKDVASKGFERRLGRMEAATDPKTIAAEKESTEDRKAELEEELRLKKAQFDAEMNAAAMKGAVKNKGNGQGIFVDEDIIGEKAAQHMRETQEKIEELEDSIRRAENRASALGEKLEDASAYDAALQAQKKINEELQKEEDLHDKIAKEIETPYEKAQAKLKELTDAAARDIISPEEFEAASGKVVTDLAKSQPAEMQQHNAAVSGENSYAAIRESINSQKNQEESPQVAALREQIEIQKKQLAATENLGRSVPVEVTLE